MNCQNKCIFLFIILLLSLVFCSVLGGNCGSEGFETETGPRGNTAIKTETGNTAVVNTNNSNNVYDNYNHYDKKTNAEIFYGPDGATAKFVNTNGDDTIIITGPNGNKTTFRIDNAGANGSATVYNGPNGTAAIISNNGETNIRVDIDGNDPIIYYPNNYRNNNVDVDHYGGVNGVTTVEGPRGNTVVSNGPNESQDYYQGMGVKRSQIPNGDEDLYILKSQVVAPVCPKCPTCPSYSDSENKNCPACPACARCPEPNFECKKIPNYDNAKNNWLPVPVLNDFSNF
jgi:hypothetical protein